MGDRQAQSIFGARSISRFNGVESRQSMLEDGDDIRTVQELLGHSGVSTTIDVLTRAEPRRAWRSESVRPALTAERRVGRESLRLTAPGSLHTFHSPIDSRHGSWRVGPLGCSPAFTAVRRSKPRRLRPTTVSPWYPRVRQVSHFSGGSTRVSRNGIPTLAARGELRSLAGGASRCRVSDSHQGSCDVFQPGFFSGVGCDAAQTSHASCGQSPPKPGTGTGGVLIFEAFRARLHGQRPAMAASGASPSTQ